MGRVSDARDRLIKAVGELIWTGSYGTTTVEQICGRAGVMKGSFYHFFESKAALAEAALEAGWEDYRPNLDGVFSPTFPPLERIRRYCAFELNYQAQMRMEHGRVLGCPYCTLGTEISTREDRLRKRVDAYMDQERRYFESAIRDAQAEGRVRSANAAAMAKAVYAYIEGLLSLARIKNNLDVLKEMESGILAILGVEAASAA
jgi:TetR/AcrR family transcriptional repressor of nem operon